MLFCMSNSKHNRTPQEELHRVCSVDEAAKMLGVSGERVKQFIRGGRIAAKRLSRDWVLSRASVQALAKIARPASLHLSRKPRRPTGRKK